MEQDPIPPDNRPEWLRALTEKSWNLELVISGAAIYLSSHLPDIVDDMLRYYLENLVLDEDLRKIALPLLVYSLMKVVAWMLIATFVAHFVMRAFWAGLVGLHTVYPQGILYPNLPWQSDLSKKLNEERFGNLSDYILRLDKLSNQVFSVAFLIALMSFGISFAYIVFFVLLNVLPLWAGDEVGRAVSMTVMAVFMVLAFMPVAMQYLSRNPKLAENPLVKRLTVWSARRAGRLLMPIVYKPITYLNLTLTSNVSKKRLTVNMALGTFLFFGGALLVFSQTFLHLNGRSFSPLRDYYSHGRGAHTLTGGLYDNLRSPEQRLPPVSIPSEVFEGTFLRVFVHYPKMLDAALAQHCAVATGLDSLSRSARNQRLDSLHLACMSDFFQLSVNDSIVGQPDWAFHEHPIAASPGLVAYLPASSFKFGKNKLTVRVPSAQKSDSLRVYGELPFWYSPK